MEPMENLPTDARADVLLAKCPFVCPYRLVSLESEEELISLIGRLLPIIRFTADVSYDMKSHQGRIKCI